MGWSSDRGWEGGRGVTTTDEVTPLASSRILNQPAIMSPVNWLGSNTSSRENENEPTFSTRPSGLLLRTAITTRCAWRSVDFFGMTNLNSELYFGARPSTTPVFCAAQPAPFERWASRALSTSRPSVPCP